MHEKIIELLNNYCRECPVIKVMYMLMGSSAESEFAVPAKLEQTARKTVKPAATRPDPNRVEKPCNKCHTVKPLSDYDANEQCIDGHEGTCRPCKRARANATYKRRMEARKQASAPAANPDKPHACPYCESRFHSIDTLSQHVKMRHGS